MPPVLLKFIFVLFIHEIPGYLSENNADTLHVLIIGDWGGTQNSPYTTNIQYSTRNIMESIASTYNITGIVALGDNFYYNGVHNVDDIRFNKTFLDVYNTPYLLNIPWYLIQGNHDHHWNASAQVIYSKHVKKWNMPYYYFNKVFNIPNSIYTLEMILLDTYIFCGLVENHLVTNNCNPPNITESNMQYTWLEKTLNESNATYIIVGGHVPIYSYSYHGPQEQLIELLNPLLMKYPNVVSYIAGHEHDLQYIEIKEQSMQYVISGGGQSCRVSTNWLLSPLNPNHTESFKYHGCNQGGFVRLSINHNNAQMFFYEGVNSDIKFETGKWYPDHTYLTIDELEGTVSPTISPTIDPTVNPSTLYPTVVPTLNPIDVSTINPTYIPTRYPTLLPTVNPSLDPTVYPTMVPTMFPTLIPTIKPSWNPSSYPSYSPTIVDITSFNSTFLKIKKTEDNSTLPFVIVLTLIVITFIVLIGCMGIYVCRRNQTKQLLFVNEKEQIVDDESLSVDNDIDQGDNDAVTGDTIHLTISEQTGYTNNI